MLADIDLPLGATNIAICDYDKFVDALAHIKDTYPEVYEDLKQNYQFLIYTYKVSYEGDLYPSLPYR
jgi:hypothetical protein